MLFTSIREEELYHLAGGGCGRVLYYEGKLLAHLTGLSWNPLRLHTATWTLRSHLLPGTVVHHSLH